VAILVSAIDRIKEDTVYLKLDSVIYKTQLRFSLSRRDLRVG